MGVSTLRLQPPVLELVPKIFLRIHLLLVATLLICRINSFLTVGGHFGSEIYLVFYELPDVLDNNKIGTSAGQGTKFVPYDPRNV